MPTDCSADLFEFAPVEGRKVVAAFDAGPVTSVVFPQIVERGSESWNGPSNRGLLSPKFVDLSCSFSCGLGSTRPESHTKDRRPASQSDLGRSWSTAPLGSGWKPVTFASRLLSAYPIDAANPNKGNLWIITEADRSATTFLLPSEY